MEIYYDFSKKVIFWAYFLLKNFKKITKPQNIQQGKKVDKEIGVLGKFDSADSGNDRHFSRARQFLALRGVQNSHKFHFLKFQAILDTILRLKYKRWR